MGLTLLAAKYLATLEKQKPTKIGHFTMRHAARSHGYKLQLLPRNGGSSIAAIAFHSRRRFRPWCQGSPAQRPADTPPLACLHDRHRPQMSEKELVIILEPADGALFDKIIAKTKLQETAILTTRPWRTRLFLTLKSQD